MAGIRLFNMHRTWEDWLGIVLGLLIILSPWFVTPWRGETPMINAVFFGAAILLLAEAELIDLHRWQESLELICGLWLVASPFAFGYGDSYLAVWHWTLGGIVALLALIELWQDWWLTDQELMQHGH